MPDTTPSNDRNQALQSLLDAARRNPDTQVGPYLLLERVGGSGITEVYRAYDPKQERLVAVKRIAVRHLSPDQVEDLQDSCAFLEQRAVPGLVRIYSHGMAGDRYYVAMEWMSGGTLAQSGLLGTLDEDEIFALAKTLSIGLGHLHEHRLWHLSIEPNSLLVDGKDVRIPSLETILRKIPAKRGGPIPAKPSALSAPEYAEGSRHSIDHRADIFGLAYTLQALVREESMGPSLRAALGRAQRMEPRKRPDNMEAFRKLLFQNTGAADRDSHLERQGKAFGLLFAGATMLALWRSQCWGPLEEPNGETYLGTLLAKGSYAQVLETLEHEDLSMVLGPSLQTEYRQRAELGIFLQSFGFHPMVAEESLQLQGSKASIHGQSIEFATIDLLQRIALGVRRDIVADIDLLQRKYPKHIEPQLLAFLYTLNYGAAEDITLLLEQPPQAGRHPSIPGLLALAYLAGDRPEHALQTLLTEAEFYPYFLIDVGMLQLRQGHHQNALDTLERALLQYPDSPSAQHHRALARIALDQAELAAADLLAWAQRVDRGETDEELLWDPEPREGEEAYLRGSAVYQWPSKAILRDDPGLAPLWETTSGAALLQLLGS
ncbi:MAG: protein kinase domain-containing protein [Planctomycetota bacterium]